MTSADDPRPTVALYHHLPPGGADRAMYELTRRTNTQFRYVLFEVVLDRRDPFHGAARAPMHDVVDEVRTFSARAGGAGRAGRWAVTLPSLLRAERRIVDAIDELAPRAVAVHHQRLLQAPSILGAVAAPTVYMVQEPRRRSFEYDLRYPEGGSAIARLASAATAPLEAWARRHDRRATRSATALLCNSDHSREYIWRAYGRDATVVRLGVDTETFVLPAADTPRAEEVLAVGALDATKDHELAIDALARIDARRRPRLRIIHNRTAPGAAEALAARARHLDVDLVLDAQVDEATLVQHYQRAQAVLLTGRVEPLGLTSLEANACGTPAVGIREGGYRETVRDEITGYLSDRNPAALATALVRLLDGELGATRQDLRDHVMTRHPWSDAAATYASSLAAVITPPSVTTRERSRSDQVQKNTVIPS